MINIIRVMMILAILTGCNDSSTFGYGQDPDPIDAYCTVSNNIVTCPDGSRTALVEPEDEVRLIKTIVPADACIEVADGVYVENIQDGTFYDVYYNENCKDAEGEICDNVKPSYGSTGTYGENEKGNATVCSFESSLVFGEKIGTDLLIKVLEVL